MTPALENNKPFEEVIEAIGKDDVEGMAQAFALLLNEAMKRERSEVLKAQPYERTEEHVGYAHVH